MAVQRSESSQGQFKQAVRAAQAGYGGRGRGSTFDSAHSDLHEGTGKTLSAHDERIKALENLDPSTLGAATGKITKPGAQDFSHTKNS